MTRRLLYLGNNYQPAVGGAEITDQLLLEAWAARGGTAGAVFFGRKRMPPLRGVELMPAGSAPAMERLARAWRPDVLYAQMGTHHLGLRLARDLGVPVMSCVHDPTPLCTAVVPLASCDRRCARCPHFLPQAAQATYGRALVAGFDRIFVPSRFMADLVKDLAGRDDAEVLYPAITPVAPTDGTGRAIAMASATLDKGTDIFLKVAELMPDREFLLAGRGDPRKCGYDPGRHPNVQVTGLLPIDAFYARAWLVVMPSRWAEAFGRMAPEAQSAGVLFMGSPVGGIPEAAGEAWTPVDEHLDPAAWVAAIRALAADPGRQEALRLQGLEAWRRFDAAGPAERFCAAAEALLAAPPEAPAAALPERPAYLPFTVAPPLTRCFYGALALALLGSGLRALGAPGRLPLGVLGVGLGALLVSLALLWALHAGPLLKLKSRPIYHSGQNLAWASLLAALGAPLLALRGPGPAWAALGLLLLLAVTAVKHRQRALRERNR